MPPESSRIPDEEVGEKMNRKRKCELNQELPGGKKPRRTGWHDRIVHGAVQLAAEGIVWLRKAVPKWKPSTAPAFAPAVPLSTVAPAETPEATALDADTAAQPEQSDGANNKLAYTGTCKDPAADSQLGKAAANEVLTADQPAPAGTTDELREVVGLAVSSGTAARAGVTGTAQRAAGTLGARPSERQLAPEARQAPDMLPAAALTKAPLPVPSPVIEHSSLDKLADWASLVGDMELPEASPAFARKGSASLDELQLDCPSSETSDSFSPDLGCEPGSYFPGPLCEALLDTEAHSTGWLHPRSDRPGSTHTGSLDMLAAAASADSTWELPASDPSALSWLKSPPADLSSPLLVTPPRRERARQVSFALPENHPSRIDDGGTPNKKRVIPRLSRDLKLQLQMEAFAATLEQEEPASPTTYSPLAQGMLAGLQSPGAPHWAAPAFVPGALWEDTVVPMDIDGQQGLPAASCTITYSATKMLAGSASKNTPLRKAHSLQSAGGSSGNVINLKRKLANRKPYRGLGFRYFLAPEGKDLEQNFRDAFFNAKLAAAWEAGHQWAAMDYNGLPMMEGAEHQRELDSAWRMLRSWRGDYTVSRLTQQLEKEWRQLETLRRRFASGRRGILKKQAPSPQQAAALQAAAPKPHLFR